MCERGRTRALEHDLVTRRLAFTIDRQTTECGRIRGIVDDKYIVTGRPVDRYTTDNSRCGNFA